MQRALNQRISTSGPAAHYWPLKEPMIQSLMIAKTKQKSRLEFFMLRVLLSAAIFGVLVAVTCQLWYPGGHLQIHGADRRLLILAGVVFVIGAVLSTAFYRPGKPRLLADLGILFGVEMLALAIGANKIYAERPAAVVFAIDRFEVMSAQDLDRNLLRYDELYAYNGSEPLLVIARLPADPVERSNLAMSVVLEGAADIDRRPDLWHPFESGQEEVVASSRSVALLEAADTDGLLAQWLASSGQPENEVAFLPIRGSVRDAVLLISRADARPLGIVDVDPWLE